MSKTWSVVKFPDEDSVEAVPTSWLNGSSLCYWPPYPTKEIKTAIERCASPKEDWKSFKYEAFRNNVFDNIDDARNKASRATKYSDLDSDARSDVNENAKLKRKVVKKVFETYSSFEEDITDLYTLPDAPIPTGIKMPEVIENIPRSNACVASTSTAISPLSPPMERINKTAKDQQKPIEESLENKEEILEYLKKILKKQNLLQGMMSDFMGQLNSFEEKFKKLKVDEPEVESLFIENDYLPIDNQEDLERFEEYLRNPANMDKCVVEISRIGGNNVYDFIFRSSKQIITNKFAGTNYSFLGRKAKKPFKNLKLSELLTKSAQNLYNKTAHDIESDIYKWLKRAQERGKKE